jgi:protein gp37
MNRTGIPYLDFCWNPCGYGCSNICNCPTCWARRQATQPGPTQPTCPDCRAFKVHFHPERLEGKQAPASRKKPAVIGVAFLGDLFDKVRPPEQIESTLHAVADSPWHTFVFLTQQYERASKWASAWWAYNARGNGWRWGTTCKNQDQFAAASEHFGRVPRWWVSAEPLQGPIHPGARVPEGIIIGCDNQVAAPYNIEWVRETALAFAVAGSKAYIKQLWLPRGGCTFLSTNPAEFPADLRLRDLPWTLTME